MALHIRHEETERLARELARRTGETLTEAISKALEERLAKIALSDQAAEDEYVARLTAISDRAAAAFKAAGVTQTSTEMLDELYDENGLPR
jgi:antitoxin VapB